MYLTVLLSEHGFLEPSQIRSFLFGIWVGVSITILVIAAIKIGIDIRKVNKEAEEVLEKRKCPKCGSIKVNWLNISFLGEKTKYYCEDCDYEWWE